MKYKLLTDSYVKRALSLQNMGVITFADTSVTEEEYLLTLFGLEMAGTLSQCEQHFLEEFKLQFPDKYFALKSLAALWKTDRIDSEMVKNSFTRLIQKMKAMGIEIDDSEIK